ncbi:MAG: cytochrome-c peroxidase [Pseudomonadales bacterium]|nr:cytochrome-c peroxidase [Pseudomonadales bacterium]
MQLLVRGSIVCLALALLLVIAGCDGHDAHEWEEMERLELESLSLAALGPLPLNPTNLAGNNELAQEMGRRLFFETRMSANDAVSCATCHQPERRFTDGIGVSVGLGLAERNAPSLIGVAYSPWFYWDGRKDSLWAQALAPIEAVNEHGSHRLQVVLLMYGEDYRSTYEEVFGDLPQALVISELESLAQSDLDWAQRWSALGPIEKGLVNQIFSNVGKAIAAYERLLMPGVSRFDQYVAAIIDDDIKLANNTMSVHEAEGLRLFIGAASCTQCHNGPLFTNNAFHNTGLLSVPGATPDAGRIRGLRELLVDEFNCRGAYVDTTIECDELKFVKTGSELRGAMRTPSLRNLQGTAPFGHAGQFPDLRAVLDHYNEALDAMIGHNEAKPLELWPWQLEQLEAFLETLAAPPTVARKWLQDPNTVEP